MNSKMFERLALSCQSCDLTNNGPTGSKLGITFCWQWAYRTPSAPTGTGYYCPQGRCGTMTTDKWKEELSRLHAFLVREHQEKGNKRPPKKAKKTTLRLFRILQKCLDEWETHRRYLEWTEEHKKAA